MSETRYYFGDASDLEGMTREEVIDATDADCVEHEDRYEEMITDVYGTVTIGLLTWDAGAVLREMDPIAFRCGLSEEIVEVDPDDYPADDDEDECSGECIERFHLWNGKPVCQRSGCWAMGTGDPCGDGECYGDCETCGAPVEDCTGHGSAI